jgi:hypothetical protein
MNRPPKTVLKDKTQRQKDKNPPRGAYILTYCANFSRLIIDSEK